MRYLRFAIVLLAAITVSCGGSAVDGAMGEVEKALERVEKNKTTMTQADWQALETELDEPLKTLAAALENNEVGPLKRVELMMLTGRVAAVFMEAGMNTATQEMQNAGISLDDLQKAAEQTETAPTASEETTATDTTGIVPTANE